MLVRAFSTPPGAFVEVGVYQGGTAELLSVVALLQNRPLYLYDTFAGIPWKGDLDQHQIGDFADTDINLVRDRCLGAVTITAGIFPNSAVPMPSIAFAHLDVDQYRSYRESIEYLTPLMAAGGVMWFDDSPCLQGACQAVTEAFGERRLRMSEGKHYVEF